MRTRRISNRVFFALAIFLHLALMASAYFWYASSPVKQSPQPLAVSVIVPAAPVSAAPPSPPRPPAPQAPPKPAKAPSRQPPKLKPAPKQAAPAPKIAAPLPQPSPDAMKEPAPESQAAAKSATEPVPPAPSSAVTQAPVKTSVSVNASYVAGQTEKWYPSLSKRYEEEGTVVVRVQVSSDGYAERVELKKRSDYPLLDEAAIGLAKSLKYNPAKVDGTPVVDWVDIPITFRLRNR